MEHCDRCGARGHLAKDCRTTQRRLALGMRGGAAKKHQNPPPGRQHGARNPSNAPNAPKDAPIALQALRNAAEALGPATKGKGKGAVDPTAKMGQFSMVEETKPSHNRDWEAESSTEVKWQATPSRWPTSMCAREARMRTHSCSGVGRRELILFLMHRTLT